MVKVWQLILLLFIFVPPSFSQTKDVGLVNITQHDGLPSNETYCVFKDSKNYLWIATDQGVAKMKGSSIQLFTDLPDNLVFKIREDSYGRIWFFSHSYKLAYFYQGKVHVFRFNNNLQEKLSPNLVLVDAFINVSNEIILDTRPLSNYKINIENGDITEMKYNFDHPNDKKCVIKVDHINDSFSFAQKLFSNEYSFNSFSIYKITNKDTLLYNIPCRQQDRFQFQGTCTLKNGDIFLFAGRNLMHLLKDGTYELKEFKKEILCIYWDKKYNCLLLGFKNGGIEKIAVTGLSEMESNIVLGNMSISSIVADFEGGIWLTTLENGIFYQKNEQISTLATGVIYRVGYYDDAIIFGNSSGIFQLKAHNIIPAIEQKNEMIHDIETDAFGNILIAGRFDDVRSQTNRVKNKIQHSGNSFLINTSSELTLKKDTGYFFRQGNKIKMLLIKDRSISFNNLPEELLPELGVIYNDNENNLWLGASKLYRSTNGIGSYKELEATSGRFTNGITCMRRMDNGMYAIGIRYAGLAVLKENRIVKIITEKDGLLSNSIKYILPDSNKIWLATAKGISVIQFSSYDTLRYSIKNFGENVGLDNCIIYQLSSFNGNILAATSVGLFSLDDSKLLLRETPVPIPLYFTNINYYLGDTSGINSISIPFKYNRLSVNFDAICYNAPKEIQYFYRMISNENSNWERLTSTQIILENLSSGDYELQIKAELPNQHRISSIQKLSITILKPWWQLNIVRVITALLILLLIFLFYRWRIKKIKSKGQEKMLLQQQMSELEQTALRSQMNPHFIFNCLTSIQQLLMTGNREEANEYLVKFSRLIRQTLELSAHPYTSIAHEKNYLTEYMELEQLRMPGQFDFYFKLDKNIDALKTELPNMMLQPIVENCIRHGIKHLQNRKGIITIEIAKQNDCLQCIVTDNGVGRSKKKVAKFSEHKSYGMGIVSKRLVGLPGYIQHNYFVEIIDLFDNFDDPAGTKVIVQVPFKTIST